MNQLLNDRRSGASDVNGGIALELVVRRRFVLVWALLVCLFAELSFVLLDYHVNYARGTTIGPLRRMFNITREDGLASWFGITQTFLVALTLWLTWFTVRLTNSSRWRRLGWLMLAAMFTYMAADDGATIHERMGSTLDVLRERSAPTDADAPSGWFPSYSWQIIFVPVFAALGLFMLIFLARELGDRTSRWLVITAVGCLTLAVGLDFFEGLPRGHEWNVYSSIADRFDLESFTERRFQVSPFTALVHFSKSLEETLEMLSMTLLWLVFLRHWMILADGLRLRFVGPRDLRG